MIECNKCGGACADDALYCVHCGARLDTKACRRCKNYVPDDAKYCAVCGYPTEGMVCPKCGKQNPDEARFCLQCGAGLSAGAMQSHVSAGAARTNGIATGTERTTSAGNGDGTQTMSKGRFAYMTVRVFVLPLLLMCLFISGFFGMFSVEVDKDAKATVTGFDAVRGMFLLIDPPTDAESEKEFNEFAIEYVRKHGISTTNLNKFASKILQNYGVLKYLITQENRSIDMIVQVLLWGLQSLALIVLSLVFFILSLVHAINFVLKKKTGVYKHETLPLALIVALTFAFIMTGEGGLAGAAVAMVVLGCIGLSGILACKRFVEKMPRASVLTLVRRGVCAALAITVICLASSSLVTVKFTGAVPDNIPTEEKVWSINGNIGAGSLYEGMENPFEYIESGISADQFLEDFVRQYGNFGSTLSKLNKNFAAAYLSPARLCFVSEAIDGFSAGAMASASLLFIANLFFAATMTLWLFYSLQDEANPERERKTALWNILSFVGVCAVLGVTIPFAVMGNSISGDLGMGLHYGVSGMIIAAAALGLANMITELVMRKIESNKKKRLAESDANPLQMQGDTI
ncbi:MAG: zinc ribbon domain-containing protein [Clostridia bacterium]|nr:zinc ribbon domain-containing protein [Clostridia bacterium]